MTANQSTVKSDMATVDYSSFQPTKPHCLHSNCLSNPKKGEKPRGRRFSPACAKKLCARIECAQSPCVPLMARLGHSAPRQQLIYSGLLLHSRLGLGKLSGDQTGDKRKQKFTTHPTGPEELHGAESEPTDPVMFSPKCPCV